MRARLRSRLRRLARGERGTQMVEFAFALPFLLLFFAGTAELGRLFYTYTTLAKATMVGARYASVQPSVPASYDQIKRVVVCGDPAGCGGGDRAPAVIAGLTEAHVTVTPPPVGAAEVKYVTVSISYDYHPLVFDLAAMTGSQQLSLDVTLTPGTTMRYMK